MKIKYVNWKKHAGSFALPLIVALAGCAAPPPFHNPPRFVLSAAQRNDSNNFPDPTKPDPMLAYYFGYSPDKTRNTRVGEGPVESDSFATSPQTQTPQPNYGHAYGAYQSYGLYPVWGNYSGRAGYYGGGWGGYQNPWRY